MYPRTMSTAALARGVAAVGLLVLVLACAPGGLHAQSISVGGSGCGRIHPSPPKDVSATAASDTIVKVTWRGDATSGPVEVTTGGCNKDTPPAQVKDLKAEAQGGGKVFLSWGPPGNNACVDTYNVACQPLARSAAASAPKPVSGGSVTIEGLSTGPHVCEVTAANGAGTGEAASARVNVS